MPVERVLTDIKRIAQVEGSPLHTSPRDDAAARTETQRIANRAVRWCIEYYYWTH